MKTIGILHPGKMGGTIAHSLQGSGHRLIWASEGRSDETTARAAEFDLEDVGTLDALVEQSEVIFCVVNGGACLDIARQVASIGFRGIYCEANGMWGEESEKEIAEIFTSAEIDYVEVGLYGWPHPGRDGFTDEHTMYLSGDSAGTVSELFNNGYWSVQISDTSAKQIKRERHDRERAANEAAGHPT